ncbi:hypothetical protein [Galbibacter orientalis]|uniref:hypothetical protein n=1 Tax=Galbibacter orientalis TaxID=453852 RepID=UPI00307FFF1C
MNPNKNYVLVLIGMLFGAFYPYGIYTLFFKLLERTLFIFPINVFTASAIAAYMAVVFALLSFVGMSKYMSTFSFKSEADVKSVFRMGVLINISIFFIWILLPIIDLNLGQKNLDNINNSYQILNSDFLISTLLIKSGSSLLCFGGVAYVVYKNVYFDLSIDFDK